MFRQPGRRAFAAAGMACLVALFAACSPPPGQPAQPLPAPPPTHAALGVPAPSVTAVATPDSEPSPEAPKARPGGCDLPTGLALVLVLDRSGSMSGAPLEGMKSAATEAAKKLADSDYLEIITFDSAPIRQARTQEGKSPATLVPEIAKITAGGGTAIFGALDLAHQDLTSVDACRKSVLLLSDGQAPTEGIRELAALMIGENVTISTVALGASADEQLLRMISEVGGGRFHSVPDPGDLPAVFIAEVEAEEKAAMKLR